VTTAGVVSWAAYLVGLGSFVAFLGIWLYRVRPWYRRAGEPGQVRRARVFLLVLSSALGVRYATGVVNLIVTHSQPADAPPAVVGSALGALIQVWLLWLLLRQPDDEQGK
jgi:hypothetical protein